MLDLIGLENFFAKSSNLSKNKFLLDLKNKKVKKFYNERQKYTNIETFAKIKILLLN